LHRQVQFMVMQKNILLKKMTVLIQKTFMLKLKNLTKNTQKTIYGEWGRPDMLILKFLKLAKQKKVFELNYNGNLYRDFTYIKSAIKLIKILSILDLKKDYDVFNICSSKPIKVIKIIDKLKISTKYQNIKNISMNKHEVYKTYGSNKKILKKIKIKNIFLPIHTGVQRTINWFNKYENLL